MKLKHKERTTLFVFSLNSQLASFYVGSLNVILNEAVAIYIYIYKYIFMYK